MNTTINIKTILDVLRVAAQNSPGMTVQVDEDILLLPDGGQVFKINELDHEKVTTEGLLHIVADRSGMYPVREGSALHRQIMARRSVQPLSLQ